MDDNDPDYDPTALYRQPSLMVLIADSALLAAMQIIFTLRKPALSPREESVP